MFPPAGGPPSRVLVIQRVPPVSSATERAEDPPLRRWIDGLAGGPRNTPRHALAGGRSSEAAGSLGTYRMLQPIRIRNACSISSPCSPPDAERSGPLSLPAAVPRTTVFGAAAWQPEERRAHLIVQRFIEGNVDHCLAKGHDAPAYAECAHALKEGWASLRASLVAAASAETPKWFDDLSDIAADAMKAEFEHLARQPLDELLTTGCFKNHLRSPELLAPLRVPILQWLALHVAELQRSEAARETVNTASLATYLRYMATLLELPLPDLVDNSTLRRILSALAETPRSG